MGPDRMNENPLRYLLHVLVRGRKIGMMRDEMKKTDENYFQLINACGGWNRSRDKRNISYGLENASMFSTELPRLRLTLSRTSASGS